jgi:host factor-I protein
MGYDGSEPIRAGRQGNKNEGTKAIKARGKSMEKLAQNIQEAFLNNARKEKTFLTIYLMSGVKLSGRIKSFDKYSVILETNNQEQLIFKHAISTVVVSRPFHSSSNTHVTSAGVSASGSPIPGAPVPSESSDI